MSNPNALSFYKKVSESAPTFYLPHHLLLSQNLHKSLSASEVNRSLYKPFPYISSYPVPITLPDAAKMDDSCCRYTTTKDSWKTKLQAMKIAHRKQREHKKIKELTLNYTGTVNVPLYVLKFSELLKDDPDPYFDSNYNWYLSGNGNLCSADINGNTCLFKSVSDELSIENYIITDNKVNEKLGKYVCGNSELIHETLFKKISKNNIVGLRQKYKIHLIKCKDKAIGTTKHLKTISTDVPYTSIVLDDISNAVLYSKVDGSITVHDINSDVTSIIPGNSPGETIVNNWSSIHLLQNNSILQTDTKAIKIFDKRALQNTLKICPLLQMNCDNITSSKLCANNSDFLFIGTIHNLCLYDLRYLNGDAFVAKWTHGLKSPPLYITSNHFEDRELISISSQLSGDLAVVSHSFGNTREEISQNDSPSIRNIETSNNSEFFYPWHPPCIHRTFENAQKLGYCLDPTLNLKKRFHMSRTGSVFYNTENEMNMLSLNSVGDIFFQKLESRQDNISEKSTHIKMQSWADQLPEDRFSFIVSSQLNVSHIHNSMKRKSQTKIKRPISKGVVNSNKSWKQSLKKLSNYEDMWANELLSVWEVEDNDTKKIDDLIPPPADTKFKIDSWMTQFTPHDED